VRRLGLRARVTAVLGLGALVLSASFAGLAYELTRTSLLEERERTAIRAAYFDASVVRGGLGGAEPAVREALTLLAPSDNRQPVIRRDGQWFAREVDLGVTASIPAALQELVESGTPAVQRVPVRGSTALVVGVPLLDVETAYFEVTLLDELQRTLRVLATVLVAAALLTTSAGAALGSTVSRRALRPLGEVAAAAGSIAAGDLSARVARDSDPDLDRLAVAFNSMVDEVQARSEADRRFAADVSHELRSPLQTLSAATTILERRRQGLDERTSAAVHLLTSEVERFEQLVTDLLELAKTDRPADRRPTDVAQLARSLLGSRGLSPDLVETGGTTTVADVDPRRMEQVLANLIDNANRHGGGVVRLCVAVHGGQLRVEVDDEGPGVPPDERELVFDRFARGRAASARGGSEGTGLGLALVEQHVTAHRGRVWITDRPGGGARFCVALPGSDT
jgi:two-component system, OmpR family, sensor histidine kinase MtrB